MPVFSIITITKDNPAGFARTKASVEAQSFDDYEWIVIDGSIEADCGIYDAMNKGIGRACGDYLIFMNAGDVFAAPETLARVAPFLKDAPDLLYGDALEGGHLKPAHDAIAYGMVTHHQAMIYKRSPRLYDTSYAIAADYKYTLEAWQAANRIVRLPFAVCDFESGGLSQRRAVQGRQEQKAIRQAMGMDAPFAPALQACSLFLKRICPAAYWLARRFFRTSRA